MGLETRFEDSLSLVLHYYHENNHRTNAVLRQEKRASRLTGKSNNTNKECHH